MPTKIIHKYIEFYFFLNDYIKKQDMLNNNIFFKIKDWTKIYLYDCTLENNMEAINNDKAIFYIYNFVTG